MGSYIPVSAEERAEMLGRCGLTDIGQLYAQVPHEMLVDHLDLPAGKSEMEVSRIVRGMAGKDRVFSSIFRGAGAYQHYIPSIVKSVTSKEEFITAYTPYQAEISQGVLQSIFEFQTMICELTGMQVANASVYDGATAAAEAVAMCRERKRVKVLVSATAHPMIIETIRTYCMGSNTEVQLIGSRDGLTDLQALGEALGEDTACLYLQQPNYFGNIEPAEKIGQLVHEAGAKFVMGVEPISLGMLKTPGECGADVAVGEGQPLGMPLSFGGPYLGFMASTTAMMRRLPGRIVGETVDSEGQRAYVLTLQAREQHIRREKASSNICSNQALCAMTAAVYLAAMGPQGLADVAEQCYAKAGYAAQQLCKLPGFTLRWPDAPFYNEFVTTCPVDPQQLMQALEARGILGGLPIEEGILWCVTECITKAQIDELCAVIEEVCA